MSDTKTNFPDYTVPFIDATGRINEVWYRFLVTMFTRSGGTAGADVTALAALLAALTISVNDDKINLAFDDVSAVSELGKEVDSLQSELQESQALLAEIKKSLSDLRNEFAQLPDPSALLAETRKNYATYASNLGQFAATTSAQLAGVISDETGTGKLVFATSPVLTTPNIGAAIATSVNATGLITSTLTSLSGPSTAYSLFDTTGTYGIGMGNVSLEGFINYSAGNASSSVFGHRWLVNGIERARVDGTGVFTFAGSIKALGGATFLTTSSALTNGAAAAAGTLTNAPAAGNPTKWIGINDNGTTRYIPSW